jgi:ketosteroid isomerase-like protein
MAQSEFELWYLLHNMEMQHWYDVNLNGGKTVHELYAEDGLFTVGPQERRGPKEIREFYEARAKRGVRTARHVLTNFRVVPGSDNGVMRATGTVSLYVGDAPPPLPSKPAVLMADLINEYVRAVDGRWLYKLHRLSPIFVGDDPFVQHALASTPEPRRS